MRCKTAVALALLVAGASVAMAQAPAPAPTNSPTDSTTDSTTARPGARARAGAGRTGAGASFGAMRGAPRVTGEITKVEGTVYTVRTQRGETVKVTVPAGTQIMKANRVAGTTADLKVGARINAMGDPPVTTPPATGVAPAPRPTTRPAIRPATPGNLTARRVMVLSPMAQGVIETISAGAITLRTPDGKSATYTIDATTRFMQNRQPATWSAFKGGERVMVEYTGKVATTVRNAPVAGQGRGAGMRQRGQGAGARLRRNAPGTAPGAAPAPNRPSSGPRPAPVDDTDGDE